VLKTLGASTVPSQANFVLARLGEPARVARGLAALGIAVRQFPGTPELRDALRITIPASAADADRLVRSLRSVMRPEALLLDMDGVIANVAESYRRAIVLAAGSFGVSVTREDVEAAKARGDANNDWIVTQRLLADAGVRADLAAVTERFEAFYTGTAGDGEGPLFERETMIPSRRTLEDLAALLPIAIVTGRPRRDCDRFLDRFGIRGLFGAIVCMEDAPRKPDPAPVAMAMARLRVTSAWMVGDTSDDLVAARGAGALPIGVIPPGTDASRLERVLRMSGAAEVHASLESIASSLKQLLAPASEASE
ncbi:MAG: HAD-IA family hydrolase, partial [Phycisphaerales bacterium]